MIKITIVKICSKINIFFLIYGTNFLIFYNFIFIHTHFYMNTFIRSISTMRQTRIKIIITSENHIMYYTFILL